MSLYNYISENFILKLGDKITKWDVSKSLQFLEDSQWWSENEIQSYQEEKLKKLLLHAYNNVPYYNELFKKQKLTPNDFHTLDDLKKIPILTKELVIENYNNGKLLSKIGSSKNWVSNQSSGSTGQRTKFYLDKSAYGYNIATNLRGWNWMGYHVGDKLVKVTQNKRSKLLKKLQDSLDRTKLFTSEYNSDSYKLFIELLQDYSPDFIRSYPDPLHFIASFANKSNINLPAIKGINTTGNTLFPEIRSLIEKTFNTKIFDSYSCDGGPNFFECPTHENYHCASESGVAEVLNDMGSDVMSGKKGRLIVTNLQNYSMPFIRYDSKDIVTKGSKCSCGRNLFTIKSIEGRDNDIIVTPSGEMLIAQTFTTYFKYFNSIDYFLVHQTEKDEAVFKLVASSNADTALEKQIIDYWNNYTKGEMNFSVEFVEEIPLLSSGKRRFLIRDKKIQLPY